MRFADTRPTVIKNTGAAPPAPPEVGLWPTPRYLAPHIGETKKLREGVAAADVLHPGYNRARRRALGLRRPRRRTPAPTTQFTAPWLHTEETHA